MQGSWRQEFGLEEICETGTPAEVSAKLLACQKMHELGLQPGQTGVWAGAEFTAPDVPCKKCFSNARLYVDAMYWSLTTMTTIGYGDRGPKTGSEIMFVLFAEVFGLCVFALLLDQISKLGAAVGAEDQERAESKNVVVQFMISRGIPKPLIDDCVRFLNFRATAFSGHAFDAESGDFQTLSPGLRELIQNAMYRPVLERVHFFGWHPDDLVESELCRTEFLEVDQDGNGVLDKQEVSSLMTRLNVSLGASELDQIFDEMDNSSSKDISYRDFHRWWFLKKYGRPQLHQPCPNSFLDALCPKLKTQAFAKSEHIVRTGDYGKSFMIILQGQADVIMGKTPSSLPRGVSLDGRRGRGSSPSSNSGSHSPRQYLSENLSPLAAPANLMKSSDDMQTTVIFADEGRRSVRADDREPTVCFAALLPSKHWSLARQQTTGWVVEAATYVDAAWISRADVMEIYQTAWSDGPDEVSMYTADFYPDQISGCGSSGSLSPSASALRQDLAADFAAEGSTPDLAQIHGRVAAVERDVRGVHDKLDRLLALMEK